MRNLGLSITIVGLLLLPQASEAGCAIRLHNCLPDATGELTTACIYKSSDLVHWVDQGGATLDPGETSTLSCSTSKCDLLVAFELDTAYGCANGSLINNVCASNIYFYKQGGDVKSSSEDANISCPTFCGLVNGCDGPLP